MEAYCTSDLPRRLLRIRIAPDGFVLRRSVRRVLDRRLLQRRFVRIVPGVFLRRMIDRFAGIAVAARVVRVPGKQSHGPPSCTKPAGMNPPDSSQWLLQLVWLGVLAVPIACVAWTVTHEEVFREPREYFSRRSQSARSLPARKFFYLLTCEYCFSHYVTIFFLFVTRYRLLLDDWRGYLLSFFALVAVANVYMSAFGRLRQEVKSERLTAEKKEIELEEMSEQ
jgi:hypothetical protein